jgi:hypothetical protein
MTEGGKTCPKNVLAKNQNVFFLQKFPIHHPARNFSDQNSTCKGDNLGKFF